MTEKSIDPIDPKGLIRESYVIEGITAEDCRGIFLDWALSLAPGTTAQDAIPRLLDRHGAPEAHPMTTVLRAGLEDAPGTQRRGGRAARLSRH
ncbi:hypothetical protein EKE94_03600 [Mesobaculum littorinae]|uniref:Uncharacterized protein n=1 Tax=Mesobaculum littorinae TaxID=2486419 RepID=A0A438ALN9_9RHOB|nr:hypothetical protein [Mesobaculum littorinae]RVV99771.1 hypothetical protein EKE94_03600 [Mesobaculum littorinae]